MKNFLKNNLFIIIVSFFAVIFFFSVSVFNFTTQGEDFVKWLSPDETANYVITKLYGQTGSMIIFEKYNLYVDDIMRPRSFRSDHGDIKPVSFLGIIIIFGTIVKYTSYKVLPYLTPLFAAIGIIYYYLLVKKIFNKNIALVSSIILAFFPVYIYYSARSMFHNVLFTVFLIIGLYYSLKMTEGFRNSPLSPPRANERIRPWRKRFKDLTPGADTAPLAEKIYPLSSQKANERTRLWWKRSKDWVIQGFKDFTFSLPKPVNFLFFLYAALAGFFVGLATITRTSELIWFGPMFFLIWIFNFKKVGFLKLAIFIFFFLLALLPMFYHNQILYSNPMLGGYGEMNQSIANIKEASSEIMKSTLGGQISSVSGPIEKIKQSFFYFGLQPGQSYLRFKHYFVFMFPWIFWTALAGGLIFLFLAFKNFHKRYSVYLLSYFIASFVLIIYYGSWGFTDNPDPNSFTIGNSYTRYWLPVYLGAFPFVSVFILYLGKMLSKLFSGKNKYLKEGLIKWFIVSISLVIISTFSLKFVLYGSEEGLVFTALNQINANEEIQKVFDLTESNSVIITFYHDKFLFPERKVVVGLFDDKAMVERYSRIVNHLPVYYYNFTLPKKDMDYLNFRRLAEFNLEIKEVKKITDDFTLYKIERSID